jgi:hypothetical protein
MSDVLWPGIAYAAVHAWSGSNWDEDAFYRTFMKDHFGSDRGEEFKAAWTSLYNIVWHRNEFNTSCWIDEETLAAAQKMAQEKENEAKDNIKKIEQIQKDLAALEKTISKNQGDWKTIERSAETLKYTMHHLLAAPDVKNDKGWNKDLIKELDRQCVQCIAWIEEDWDKNRYPDDPNKDGLYLTNQHLLYRFKQMHQFHQKILK